MYTREQIEAAVKAKGYVWFSDSANKNFDVNIVGVRNMSTGDMVTNVFDDFMTISYKEGGVWKSFCWNATTDPGNKSMMNFENTLGCARLVPGQYRGAYSIGLHQGKYEAVRQVNPVKVYRDKNKDQKYDETTITEGVYGINLHRAGENSTFIDGWSAGCQVFKRVKDFNAFMSICKKAAKIHGNAFTYTLLTSEDII